MVHQTPQLPMLRDIFHRQSVVRALMLTQESTPHTAAKQRHYIPESCSPCVHSKVIFELDHRALQSPKGACGHRASFCFCNQCNPRTHLSVFSNPVTSTSDGKVTLHTVGIGSLAYHLVRDDTAKLTQPRRWFGSDGHPITAHTTARLGSSTPTCFTRAPHVTS